jgi:hypothetical protein
VTADEVEAVRSLTPEAARRRFAHAVARARAAVAACAAAPPAAPATPGAAAGGAADGARRSAPCCHSGGSGSGSGRGGGGGFSAASHTPAGVGGACCVCAGAELAFVPGPERAEAAAAGHAVRRLHVLLALWNGPALFFIATHHMERGHACTGGDDAPPTHWDATARAARFCRE